MLVVVNVRTWAVLEAVSGWSGFCILRLCDKPTIIQTNWERKNENKLGWTMAGLQRCACCCVDCCLAVSAAGILEVLGNRGAWAEEPPVVNPYRKAGKLPILDFGNIGTASFRAGCPLSFLLSFYSCRGWERNLSKDRIR